MIGFRLPNGQQIELAPGVTISMEINNALLADSDNNGSYTLPVTAPRTNANELAMTFAGLLDSPTGASRRIEGVEAFDDDELLATGTLVLLRITPVAYELSLITGLSAIMTKLKARKLSSFVFGGQRPVSPTPQATPEQSFVPHMNAVLASPEDYDYVFAPISNNDFIADNPEGFPRRANINSWYVGLPPTYPPSFMWSTGYFPPLEVVPGLPFAIFPGYFPAYQSSCVPFPRLGYVVRTMLQELQIPFEEDFFDDETEQLVIIGNTPIDDLRTNSEAKTFDFSETGIAFRIGDVLPDVTAHELLRALADTFYLDLSISPIGVLRMRRSARLLAEAPQLSLTAQATPGFTVDVPDEQQPGLRATYRTDHDSYAASHYQPVDPLMRNDDVTTKADLPAQIDFEHEIRLVLDERAYYQHDGSAWQFYSVDLLTITLGTAGDSATEYAQGTDLILEQEMQTAYILPLPGAEWPPLEVANPAYSPFAIMRAGVFGERGYSPTANMLTRSQAVRLGFYRGMQPYKDGAGVFPMLTQINLDLQGERLGDYSLRLDGPDGTVARFGEVILEARHSGDVVTWPVWLTAEQINQIDLGRIQEINGIHFLVKKINVTYPIRKAAELQLVVLRPRAVLE